MKKILIYGDIDLNLIDGSSVWLVNLARLLSMDEEIISCSRSGSAMSASSVSCAAFTGSDCCM